MPLNTTNLLEEYKNLRTELVSTMGTISNIFNYGLVTLGLSFTAIQFIFNQINEFTKSSSTSNLQLESLFILLWILLVGFVPFVCIIFIFKWLSNARAVALISTYIYFLEKELGMAWEHTLRMIRKSENRQFRPFIVFGGWHPMIIFLFFTLIGFISQIVWWLGVKSSPLLLILSGVILIVYIGFVLLALQEYELITNWLTLKNLPRRLYQLLTTTTTPPLSFLYSAENLIITNQPIATNTRRVSLLRLFRNTLTNWLRQERRRWQRWRGGIIILVILVLFLIWLNQRDNNPIISNNPISSSEIMNQKIVNKYFDDVNKVTSSNEALTTKRENTLSNLRGLTKEALKKTDTTYKDKVIGFLYNLELLGYPATIGDEIECQKQKTNEAVNLNRANLKGIKINTRNWQCINLREANLKGAEIKDSVLTNAVLDYTILVNADLSKSNLANASFKGANLKDAKFKGTNLEGANLQGISFIGKVEKDANKKEKEIKKFKDKIKFACNFEKAQYDSFILSAQDIKALESSLNRYEKYRKAKNCRYLEHCKTNNVKVCPIINSD